MQSDKLQQINIDLHIELADISPKEASKLCEYITDYIVKHHIVVDYSYSVKDGE